MPYQSTGRLPPERASKLGHLDVLNSQLVNKLVDSFNDSKPPQINTNPTWQDLTSTGEVLSLIFGVDGSVQTIESETLPNKRVAFVKTALLRLDQFALSKIDRKIPHPMALRDVLSDSALYHATVFPLRHVSIPDMCTYHAIRKIIFDSIKDDSLDKEIMETFKWIVYEKWDGTEKKVEFFECPHCHLKEATLPYDSEVDNCPNCGEEIFLTDMLGFHQVMAMDTAPDEVARDYMTIHETLLLFTGVKYFWENKPDLLSKCLFVKDGPLSIRAQYSKLVAPIRRFLAFAREKGIQIHIMGQEKTGRFHEHLELIGKDAPDNSIFIPSDLYIKQEIQHRPETGAPYGKDTNYGAKLFFKMNSYYQIVLNIPIGEFNPDPLYDNLIGANNIFATIPTITSMKYESGLLPIELAHGVASLSTYPSARILRIFAGIDE
jgi:hypothetical protein